MYRAIYSFGLAIALALSFGCSVGALAQARDTIRLTIGKWQPYFSKSAPHYGFASHIVTEAFALVSVDVDYGFFPWKRTMKLARDGKWNGSAVWLDTEERRVDFFYSDPTAPGTNSFFHLKSYQFDWNGFEDLKDVRIGATLGYSYGPAFDAADKAGTIKVQRAPNDETSLRKLLKGRIDAFAGNLLVTYAQIRDTVTAEEAVLFTHHPKHISQIPLHVLFSKNVPGMEQMRDRFNEGLRMLKVSGRWDQMIADGLAGKYDAKPE